MTVKEFAEAADVSDKAVYDRMTQIILFERKREQISKQEPEA